MKNQTISDLPRLICHNDKLTLIIPSANLEPIDFHKLCEKYDKDFQPNVLKKIGKRYIICKSLEISNENTESSVEKSSKKCEINARLVFKYIAFGEVDSKESLRIDFQHCEFNERVYFTNCEFNGNVFFNHAVFHKYADFHESFFNAIVSFYNATFNSAPNFSPCVFSSLQATNFINVKMEDLDFCKILYFVGERINDKTYKKELKSLQAKYPKESKEYKEEKQKLTQKHRIRYASNARDSFRTIKNVLIENRNLLDASSWHKLELYAKEKEIDLKNPKTFSKDWCDKIQLCFYRHTSAHHTDLLESIKSLFIVIGIFGVLSCVVIVRFALYCGFWDWNPNTLIKCYNEYIECFLAEHYCIALGINIVLFVAFMGIFILTIICQKIRNITFWLSCAVALFILVSSPKYLIPAIEIFTDKKMLLDPLSVMGGVYSILFGFMLCSFIKTARKNSIISS